MMHRHAVLIATVAAAAAAAPALAEDVPYAKLADMLGTPKLADSAGPADHSTMLLHFVPGGQSVKKWSKLTTVSILKVPGSDTDAATIGVISDFKRQLEKRKVAIGSFDESPLRPYTCYFTFRGDGESDAGVVYSPASGFVTVAQVAVRGDGAVASADRDRLRSIIAR